MRKKILSIFSALLITILLTSTVGARGAIKLSGVSFSLGSLIAKGYAGGLGNTDVTIKLDASGPAAIICTNNGSNDVPGQSSPKVSASGLQSLLGDDPIRKNGKSPFDVETDEPAPISWSTGGCPNSNWTARIDFVFWKNATIYVYDTATQILLKRQDYVCVTTREPASVTCTLTN